MMCFKMVSYKVNHRIYSTQRKISIQCHTIFVLRPRKQNQQRKNYGEKG